MSTKEEDLKHAVWTIRSIIADDAFAASHQSLGQYRTALLTGIAKVMGEILLGEPTRHPALQALQQECDELRTQLEALTEPMSRVRKALTDRQINTAVDELELLRTAANIVAEDGGIIAHLSGKVEAMTKPVVQYTQGAWFMASSIDEMQLFFESRLPAIRATAYANGYAIGVHGSMRRDLDLIAAPWREGAADAETLAHAIAKAACGIDRDGAYNWEQKPFGRIATSLPICWVDNGVDGAGHIDLSVMPQPLTRPAVPEGWKLVPVKADPKMLAVFDANDGFFIRYNKANEPAARYEAVSRETMQVVGAFATDDEADALAARLSYEKHWSNLLAAVPQPEEQSKPKPISIELDFKQATELLEMFGGEPGLVTLIPGDGHSGHGLYACWTDVPGEGAIYLGNSDDEAQPTVITKTLDRDGILGKAGDVVTATFPALADDEAQPTEAVQPTDNPSEDYKQGWMDGMSEATRLSAPVVTAKDALGLLAIEDDAIVLRLTADAAASSFANDPKAQTERPAVTDKQQFLRDVFNALSSEREDGSTRLTDVLDWAEREAWEQGSLGLAAQKGGV